MFDWMDDISTQGASLDKLTGPYIPDASDCMHCGLCISLCPTYKLNQIEAETPRSRIRTIDKILNDTGKVFSEELIHLNNCTQCRVCETICPSQMAYGQLFDQTREKLLTTQTTNSNRHFLAPIGFKLLEYKKLFSAITVLIAGYQYSGLVYLVRKTPIVEWLKLDKADNLLPKVNLKSLADNYPSSNPIKGTLGLFTGCMGTAFDQETLLATLKVLNNLGFSVLVPKQQNCCGALHQHQGQRQIADQLATYNIHVFNTLSVDAIIYTASACGLMLKEYAQKEALGLEKLKAPLFDITEYLCEHWPQDIKLYTQDLLDKSVAVHEPCSQRNITKVSEKKHEHTYRLLEKVTGLSVNSLPDNQTCCGAGGLHCLTHPEIAGALRALKLKYFKDAAADYLVSTNLGCALHLNSGNTAKYSPVSPKVIHPIILIAKAWEN
jgi:glycolate oxidase iron-sulfur subunit